MVLESTMICFDNSDYQRNGDYFTTRLSVQKDGVHLVCLTKTRSNPENNIGLMTMAKNAEVLATLTSDVGRVFSKLHAVQPNGEIQLLTSIRIAHLVLKHRQGRNHKMRIVIFVGSPITNTEGDLVKLAKRLKKEKVQVDVVSFGEHENNNEILAAFINTLNGKDGSGSHLVSVPRGSDLSEALLSSPIIQGEDGLGGAGLTAAGFEFGVDPNEDPELALALRVSMEEQRQRQEDEQRQALADSNNENAVDDASAMKDNEENKAKTAAEKNLLNIEEEMLQRALRNEILPEFLNMTEEEQIEFAMKMSMHDASKETVTDDLQSLEVDEDFSEVMTDPTFLQTVLENLPGVDAKQSENDEKNNAPKK